MIRIWLTAAAMGLAVIGAHLLTPVSLPAAQTHISLEDMIPERVGTWRLDQSVRPVLPRKTEDERSLAARLYDQTLVRTYRNSDHDRVMLVVAYGRDQSDALQLHLPEVCYASQGFAVKRTGRAVIDLDGTAAVPVMRLRTRRGGRYEPVTYWTRVGDAVVLSRLSRQWAKLSYGLRGKIPDGVLIRVSTISKRPKRAFATQERFVRDLLQAVASEERPFFLGKPAH